MHSLAVVTSNRLLDHTLYAVASITPSSSSICLLLAAGIPPHPVTPSASLFSSFHFDSSQSRAPLFSSVSLTAPIASVPGSKAYAIHLSSNPTALLTRLAKIKGLQPNSNEVVRSTQSHATALAKASHAMHLFWHLLIVLGNLAVMNVCAACASSQPQGSGTRLSSSIWRSSRTDQQHVQVMYAARLRSCARASAED
ncbi:hypothetical protein SMMN14_09030, partial [Sphaerulina musiva]